jgi:hypothetical protein
MTDIKNADTPANPTHYSNFTNAHGGSDEFYSNNEGLTKREAFAMAAMQGIIASDVENVYTTTDIAEISVTQADALLKELAK